MMLGRLSNVCWLVPLVAFGPNLPQPSSAHDDDRLETNEVCSMGRDRHDAKGGGARGGRRLHPYKSLWNRLLRQFVPKLPGEQDRQRLTGHSDSDGLGIRKDAGFDRRRLGRSSKAVEIRSRGPVASKPQDSFHDEEEEAHIGMILEVYHDDGKGSVVDVVYELLEPMHLELGVRVKHASDYAYTPVITAGVEPVFPPTGTQNENSWLEESGRWWRWLPWWKWTEKEDSSSQYRMNGNAFGGGSHGEVWRGRRRCREEEKQQPRCNESLIFKRLKVELGYTVLEAGLREVYFGNWLLQQAGAGHMFTSFVDHFFRKILGRQELWIAYADAGSSLRSFLYTGVEIGDLVFFQHSYLWTQLRKSLQNTTNRNLSSVVAAETPPEQSPPTPKLGKQLMRTVLRQILSAAAFLHEQRIVHRDIKPSNVMCKSNLDTETLHFRGEPFVQCVLGDFSSAWNDFTERNLYSKGPSRAEQTDEYAPPEAIFDAYNETLAMLTPAFDSWSIGIVALELLLGTPNVFSVDQRTRVVLSHKMQKQGASPFQIKRAIYLAALSQFCIYHPSFLEDKSRDWKLPHSSAMVKKSCTINDFHRALRARDPLGLGFDSSADTLLNLIWQLLAWDPKERMTAAEALRHPYFTGGESSTSADTNADGENALESQMLDPRMDFNISDSVSEFVCPKCGRVFDNWASCHKHARARKHAKFCSYDKRTLPTCLNAHSMLPAHAFSGYCDIQGRRRVIEDFHAIHLLPSAQFYVLLDGHRGNSAAKFAASFLHKAIADRLSDVDGRALNSPDWKRDVENRVVEAFADIHQKFLKANALNPYGAMDQSGTTATALLMTPDFAMIASLGDSRAVISSSRQNDSGETELIAIDLTKDHVASDPGERALVENRGGHVLKSSGIDRVNGILAITRSIGDADLAPVLSQVPDVVSLRRDELKHLCGTYGSGEAQNCFLILASDGLWDVVSSQEAIEMVEEIIATDSTNWRDNSLLQQAAEALTLEAFVRGSKDNIGVCVIAVE